MLREPKWKMIPISPTSLISQYICILFHCAPIKTGNYVLSVSEKHFGPLVYDFHWHLNVTVTSCRKEKENECLRWLADAAPAIITTLGKSIFLKAQIFVYITGYHWPLRCGSNNYSSRDPSRLSSSWFSDAHHHVDLWLINYCCFHYPAEPIKLISLETTTTAQRNQLSLD